MISGFNRGEEAELLSELQRETKLNVCMCVCVCVQVLTVLSHLKHVSKRSFQSTQYCESEDFLLQHPYFIMRTHVYWRGNEIMYQKIQKTRIIGNARKKGSQKQNKLMLQMRFQIDLWRNQTQGKTIWILQDWKCKSCVILFTKVLTPG